MYVDDMIAEVDKLTCNTEKVLHICDFIRILEFTIETYSEKPRGEPAMYRALMERVYKKTKDDLEKNLVIAKTLLEVHVKK